MANVHELLLAVLGDSSDAQRTLANLSGELRAISAEDTTATVNIAGMARAKAQLASLRAELAAIDHEDVSPVVSLNISRSLSDLDVLDKKIKDVIEGEHNRRSGATDDSGLIDTAGLIAEVETAFAKARAAVSGTNAAKFTVQVDLDRLQLAETQLLAFEGELRALDGEHVSPELDLKIGKLLVEAELAKRKIAEVKREAEGNGGIVTATALTAVFTGVAAFGKQAADALGEVDDAAKEASSVLSGLKGAFGTVFSEQGIGAFAGKTRDIQEAFSAIAIIIIGALLPAIVALAGSLAAAITGAAGLAAAFTAALGPAIAVIVALFSRFTAIMNARKALQQQDAKTTQDSAAAAQRAAAAEQARHQALVGLRDAQQGSVSAERRLAEARQSASDALDQAAGREADAHRSTLRAIEEVGQADQRVSEARIAARKRIAEAVRAEGDAERALARTVEQNARRLEDAQDRVRDAVEKVGETAVEAMRAWRDAIEDVKDAQLALEDATLGVAEANLSVEEAQQRVNDLLGQTPELAREAYSALQKIQDVDFGPDAFAGVTQSIGQIGGGSGGTDALELKRALLELARAKLGVQQATNRQEDAERGLSDAQSTANRFAREGIAAYQPYTDALKAAADAQESLTDVQRDNADSLRESSRNLRDSAAALRDLQRAGVEGAPEVRSALQSEADARRRVADARRNEAEAERDLKRLRDQGIEGNPQVISALDAVRDAHERLREARRQLQRAENPLEKIPADAAKADDALGKLSGTERRFLGQLQTVIDAFRDATSGATDAVIGALGDALQGAGPLVRGFRGLFTNIGQTWASAIRSGAKSLAGPAWQSALKTIFGGTADISRSSLKAIGDLLVIFRNLAVAVMPLLVDLFDRGERALAGLAAKTNDIGGLRETFVPLVAAFRAWVALVGALLNVFVAFGQAVGPIGTGLVKWITDGANAFARWMRSAQGRNEIKAFFDDTLPLAKAAAGLIAALALAFIRFGQIAAPVFTPILELLRAVFFASAAFYGIMASLLNLDFSSALENAKRLIGAVLSAFTDPIALAKAAAAGVAISVAIGTTVSAFRLVGGLLMQALMAGMRGAAVLIRGTVAFLAGRIVLTFAVLEPLMAAAGAAITAAISFGMAAASAVVAFAAAALATVIELALVAGPFILIGIAIVAAIAAGLHFREPIAAAAKAVVKWIVDGVTSVVARARAIGRNAVNAVASGVRAGVGAVRSAARQVASAITGAITGLPARARSIISSVATAIVGRVRTMRSSVTSAARSVAQGFVNAFAGIARPIGSFFRGVANLIIGVANNIVAAVNFIIRQVNRIPNINTPFGSIGIPNISTIAFIPRLASGGVTTGSTLANIGEAGREAVLPLTRAVFADLGAGIAEAMAASTRSASSRGLAAAAAAAGGGDTHQNFIIPPSPAAHGQPDPRVTASLLAREMRKRQASIAR